MIGIVSRKLNSQVFELVFDGYGEGTAIVYYLATSDLACSPGQSLLCELIRRCCNKIRHGLLDRVGV